jgi:energy-coupling factor transport system permease protein
MALELSRNIVIGQYLPGDTLVHRLDPRTKILCSLFLLLGMTFTRSLAVSLAYLAVVALLIFLAHIPLNFVLRPFIAGLPFIGFFLVLSVLWQSWQAPTGVVLFEWGWIRITSYAVGQALLSLSRLMSLLMLISLPMLTTKITQLTYGVELLLKPLTPLGVPAHEIALIATIALRFVPILAEELERVMRAQASRGGEIGALSWRRPVEIATAISPLVVPLFVNAFRRAEDMAIAMEARCYMGGGGRTRFLQLKARPVDYAATVFMFALVSGIWFYTVPLLSYILTAIQAVI